MEQGAVGLKPISISIFFRLLRVKNAEADELDL